MSNNCGLDELSKSLLKRYTLNIATPLDGDFILEEDA
jgi:hypothetical protein